MKKHTHRFYGPYFSRPGEDVTADSVLRINLGSAETLGDVRCALHGMVRLGNHRQQTQERNPAKMVALQKEGVVNKSANQALP